MSRRRSLSSDIARLWRKSRDIAGTSGLRRVRSSPSMRRIGAIPGFRWMSEAPSCRAVARIRSNRESIAMAVR